MNTHRHFLVGTGLSVRNVTISLTLELKKTVTYFLHKLCHHGFDMMFID